MKKARLLSLLKAEDNEWLASLADDAALIVANQEAAEAQDRIWDQAVRADSTHLEYQDSLPKNPSLRLAPWSGIPDAPYYMAKSMVMDAGWSPQVMASGAGPGAEQGFIVTAEAETVWTFAEAEDRQTVLVWVTSSGSPVAGILEVRTASLDECLVRLHLVDEAFRVERDVVDVLAEEGGLLVFIKEVEPDSPRSA